MIGNTITMMSARLWHPQVFNGNVCSQTVCLPSFLPLSITASCCFCQHTCKNVSDEELSSECTVPLAGGYLPDYSLTVNSSEFSSSCFSFSFFSGNLLYWPLAAMIITLLIAIISQLLMNAGDIETNPGPKHGADYKPSLDDLLCMSYIGEYGKDTRFRLMDQLQPHWRRLAIALKFLPCDITVMEHKDDPVYHLLSEWLRGANQERDSRPVTWGTLITALRDANVQEESNMLEKHFVQTESAPVAISQSGDTMRHGPVKVSVGPSVPEDLFALMDKYYNMLLVVKTAKLSSKKFRKLKLFLSDYCAEKSIYLCKNLCAIVDLLVDCLKLYIFNIDTLTVSCKHFYNAKVQVSVQEYKKHLNEFLSATQVKNFKDALRTEVSDSSSVEEITLKLNENINNNTLRELNHLVYHFFGNISRSLIYCKIDLGCVCITWLLPVSMVPTLRAMVKQRLQDPEYQDHLERHGVLELVIGLRIEVVNPVMAVEKVEAKLANCVRMCKARDKEISSIRREMDILYNRWFAVQKQNEVLESELKGVRQEKSNCEEQCDKLENELKKVRKQKFDFEEKSRELEREVEIFQQKENTTQFEEKPRKEKQ